MQWKYKISSSIICEGQLYELILGVKKRFFLLSNSEINFLLHILEEFFATY